MLLFAAAASLAGCTYQVHRAGDDRFLQRERPWTVGVTRAEDVALDLGPPDHIAHAGGGMIFVYRFRRATSSGFAVKLYLTLFSHEAADQIDSTLVVAFDAQDRLLYHAVTE